MNSLEDRVQKFVDDISAELAFGEARLSVEKEIRSHLEESIETGRSYGLSEQDAIQDSIKRMGMPKEIGKSLNLIHRPKFDFLLPILTLILSAIGLWNLSETQWIALQSMWVFLGILIASLVYHLPVAKFRNFLPSLYLLAIIGLVISNFSEVVTDGQPYFSLLGLNIRIIDLTAILFSLGFPMLSFQLRELRFSTISIVLLFLLPIAYFSLSGFIWAALLFLVSGLCFLGTQKISNTTFLVTGVVSTGLVLSNFSRGLVSIAASNKAIVENAHTDYAFRSLSQALTAEALAASLLIAILMYGLKLALCVKEQSLRSIAIVSVSLMSIQVVTSVLANVGTLPMISAGVNVPFVSYGGTGIVANFLILGCLLACFKRNTLSVI